MQALCTLWLGENIDLENIYMEDLSKKAVVATLAEHRFFEVMAAAVSKGIATAFGEGK